EKNVVKQIDVAMEEADVLMLVMDGKQPVRQLSPEVLKKFRTVKKPLILAVNKLDSPKTREVTMESFKALGIKKIFAVSAISGTGLGDMLDEVSASVENREGDAER